MTDTRWRNANVYPNTELETDSNMIIMTNGSLPGQYTERLSASAGEINLVSIHFGPTRTNHRCAAMRSEGPLKGGVCHVRTIRMKEPQRLSSSRALPCQHAPAFADIKQTGLPTLRLVTIKVCLSNGAMYADTGPLRHLKAKSVSAVQAGRRPQHPTGVSGTPISIHNLLPSQTRCPNRRQRSPCRNRAVEICPRHREDFQPRHKRRVSASASPLCRKRSLPATL